jgi:hypothetical protein
LNSFRGRSFLLITTEAKQRERRKGTLVTEWNSFDYF